MFYPLHPVSSILLIVCIFLVIALAVAMQAPKESAPESKAIDDAMLYGLGLVDDVRALEWLDRVGVDFEYFDELDPEQVEYFTLEGDEIDTARQIVKDLGDDAREFGSWSAAYFNDSLDIESHYKGSAGARPDLDKVGALVAFGGPSARIVSDGSDDIEIIVNWWDESYRARIYAPAVSAHLWAAGEMSDYMAGV